MRDHERHQEPKTEGRDKGKSANGEAGEAGFAVCGAGAGGVGEMSGNEIISGAVGRYSWTCSSPRLGVDSSGAYFLRMAERRQQARSAPAWKCSARTVDSRAASVHPYLFDQRRHGQRARQRLRTCLLLAKHGGTWRCWSFYSTHGRLHTLPTVHSHPGAYKATRGESMGGPFYGEWKQGEKTHENVS